MRKIIYLPILFFALFMVGYQPIQPQRFPLEFGGGPIVRVDDLKHVALSVDDFPEGWTMLKDQPLASNDELAESWNDAEGAKVRLKSLGREGGWYQYFAKPGIFFETNEVNISLVVLKNPQAAIDYLDFNYLRDKEAVDSGAYTSMSPVSAPKFGETSVVRFGKKPKSENSDASWTWYDVSFQMYNVVVFVETYSTNSYGDMNEAVRVSKLIEEKLSFGR